MTRLQAFSRPTIAATLGAMILLVVQTVPAHEASGESLEEIQARLSALFPEVGLGPENVRVSPIEGWYTIQKGSIIAYVTEDGRFLMQGGDLIDLDSAVNLTEESRSTARLALLEELGDDVIRFSPEAPRHSVTVFTDIDCTFCRRLHNQINEYLAMGIEVNYILYPRNGPASPTWALSEQVWCASDRNHALTAAKQDKEFDSVACDASIVQQNYLLGRQVGLAGTPATVFPDGTLVSGYLPPKEMAQQLESLNALARN